MSRPKRKRTRLRQEDRAPRFSKTWDRRLGIAAVVLAIGMVLGLLEHLAESLAKPEWYFEDYYHAAGILLPLGCFGWLARMLMRERAARNRKK